jgi:hypothetical protein
MTFLEKFTKIEILMILFLKIKKSSHSEIKNLTFALWQSCDMNLGSLLLQNLFLLLYYIVLRTGAYVAPK